MDTIQIKDKRFKTFIPEADILKEVARVGQQTGTYDAAGRQRDGVKGASLFETEV